VDTPAHSFPSQTPPFWGLLFICLFCTPFAQNQNSCCCSGCFAVDFLEAKGEMLGVKIGGNAGYQCQRHHLHPARIPRFSSLLDMPAMRNNAANVNGIRIWLMPIAMLMLLFYTTYPCCSWHLRGHRTISMHDLTFPQNKHPKCHNTLCGLFHRSISQEF